MSIVAVLFLVIFAAGWYLLALLPALRELSQKTDARPLKVVSDYGGSATFFARSSVAFISANFPGTYIKHRGERIEGRLDNGDPYSLIPFSDDVVELEPADLAETALDRVLITYAPIRVPERSAAMATIYAAREVLGGDGSVYRALFCELDLQIGANSIVLRWVHSEGNITALQNCQLFGRASAGKSMRLLDGCEFERLAAPRIEFGASNAAIEDRLNRLTPTTVPHLPEYTVPRSLVRASVTIPANSFVSHDIVSSGSITVGAGCWIARSLKAAQDIYIAGEVRVDGSVVAERDIFIGAQSIIRGPVIGERNVLIEGPTSIGTAELPTTITAPVIYCSAGVLVHGTLWAREEGGVAASARIPDGIAAEHVA